MESTFSRPIIANREMKIGNLLKITNDLSPDCLASYATALDQIKGACVLATWILNKAKVPLMSGQSKPASPEEIIYLLCKLKPEQYEPMTLVSVLSACLILVNKLDESYKEAHLNLLGKIRYHMASIEWSEDRIKSATIGLD